MTRDFHRDESALFRAGLIGKWLLACVALFASALAIAFVYDSGTFNTVCSAQDQDKSDRELILEGYKTEALAEWHVFLAATNHYSEGIPDLQCAEADVNELLRIFKALGAKDENITVLKSTNTDPYKMPLKSSFDEKYDEFLKNISEYVKGLYSKVEELLSQI